MRSARARRFSALLRAMVASTALQALGGGGARLQPLEPHVEAVLLGLALLANLVERDGKLAAFGIDFGEVGFDLAELRARRGQRILALGRGAAEAGGLVEALVDGDLQGTLVVVEQRQLFAHVGDLALELDVTLFGAIVLRLQRAVVLAERTAFRGLARQLSGGRRSHC
jgi:hypothetical protein